VARRKIKRTDEYFYLVDACFLANRYIPVRKLSPDEKQRVERCRTWWAEINKQQRRGKAIVYIPDVCIAEAFKVLAKKHIREKVFTSSSEYVRAKNRLSDDITIEIKKLKKPNRKVYFHDISTSRDVIISVDRFLETFMRRKLDVTVPDLIVLATEIIKSTSIGFH